MKKITPLLIGLFLICACSAPPPVVNEEVEESAVTSENLEADIPEEEPINNPTELDDSVTSVYNELLTSDAGAIYTIMVDTNQNGNSGPPVTAYMFPFPYTMDQIKGNSSTVFGSMSECSMETTALANGDNFNYWVFSLGIDPGESPTNGDPKIERKSRTEFQLDLKYNKSSTGSSQSMVVAFPVGLNGKVDGSLIISYAMAKEKGKSKKTFNSSAGSIVPNPIVED